MGDGPQTSVWISSSKACAGSAARSLRTGLRVVLVYSHESHSADANGPFKVEHMHDTSAESEDNSHAPPPTRFELSSTRRFHHWSPCNRPPFPFTRDSCEYAKTMLKPIRKERAAPSAQAFGNEIHTDVWEPSPTSGLGRDDDAT